MPEQQAYLSRSAERRGPFKRKFPVNFPVSREFDPETGSLETASTTIQSALSGGQHYLAGIAPRFRGFRGGCCRGDTVPRETPGIF